MNQARSPWLGWALTAALLLPWQAVNAWVAAGGHGGVVYHGGGYAHGGSYYHSGGGYYHSSCYGCGGAAFAVGAMAGLALASAAAPPRVIVQQPATVYIQQPAPLYETPPAYPMVGNLPLGSQVAVPPPGAALSVVNGDTYYRAGPTWFKPYYGSSGVYYQVVLAPL